MLLQIGRLLRLGSKCYYGWDLYYTWVQMLLLQIGPLLHWGTALLSEWSDFCCYNVKILLFSTSTDSHEILPVKFRRE